MFSLPQRYMWRVVVLVMVSLLGLMTLPVLANPVGSTTHHAPNATLTVTNTNDSGPGSLRQAVADAYSGDTINFNLIYPAAITLTSGEILISRDITVVGPGATRLTISGNGTSRIFNIGSGAVELADLTVAQGDAASLYGGGIYYGYDGGVLTLTRVNVLSNTAAYGGGVFLSSGNVMFNDGEVRGNDASSEGGGIHVYSGSVTLNGEQIRSNTSRMGGGIFIQSGDVTLNGGQIISNTASSGGGGVYINQFDANFTQTGGAMALNTAFNGGAVYINSGSMTLNGGQVIGNAASSSGWGGGVFISSGGNLLLNAGMVVSNTAERGGGVGIDSGNALIDGGEIISNTATNYGGGVYIRGNWQLGSATLSGGQIAANVASEGGGVYVETYLATFVQTGVSTITHNTAQYGGGLYSDMGYITLEGGQVVSNTAVTNGGGLWAGSGDVSLANVKIISNAAGNRGGGLYTSSVVMTNTEILSNTAVYEGGGAYAINSDLRGGVFQNNISTYGSGGGLYTVHLLMIDTQFLSNAAYSRSGGALMLDAHISGGVFQRNRCTSPNCDGGGLMAFDEVVMTDTQFVSNTSTGFGGGASFWANAYLTNVAFQNNHCTSSCGGGVYLSGFNNVLTNVLLADNDSGSDGGGICIEGLFNSLTTLVNSTLRNNTASHFGGGVYNQVHVLVEHSTLSGNFAGPSGGGIYSTNALTISHSTLSSNSASAGGGVYSLGDYYEDNLVTIDYSTFSGNSARNGGGIYNDSSYADATVNLHRSIIAGNSATDLGPEVYNSGTVTAADYNVVGYEGSARSFGFTPSGTDIVPVGALNTVLNSTLQDNGGPNFTHALVSGSPAVDAVPIDGSNCNPPVTIDQRGAVRADGVNRGGTACDSGAYEYDSAQTPTAVSLLSLTANSAVGSADWLVAVCLGILGSALLIRWKRVSIN
ncbi:putative outer membrane protein PmpB [Thermoflexales bacterium]|nr:putative outer membrane protein PmpB [Thermoflexales bacterium]